MLSSNLMDMENYPILFPQPSSSYHSSLLPPNMLNTQAFNNFHVHGSNHPSGFLGLKGPEEDQVKATASSDGVHGSTTDQVEAFGGLESGEVKPAKKKGEKKVRKPRYAFQTRSQVDILDDGYRWRKYGQKAVKNNKFPRSYYRCTHQGCNVKKQVQRLSKDEGVVVTTYEGMHSHPIEKSNDNFEHILSQMQIYTNF